MPWVDKGSQVKPRVGATLLAGTEELDEELARLVRAPPPPPGMNTGASDHAASAAPDHVQKGSLEARVFGAVWRP